jgi:hypothetical protein
MLLFVLLVTELCVIELIWQRIFDLKIHQNCLNEPTKQPTSTLYAHRRFLLSEEKQASMIRQKLKLHASKLLQFLHVHSVHLTMPLIIEDTHFCRMGTFWCTLCFFTINPLGTRSPFCWKLCNADFNRQRYSNLGEAKPVMPNNFEIIKLLRANPVAQAIFFRIILKLFRTIACDFFSSNQYSQDVDANGKPMGFFGPLDLHH